MKRFAVTTTIRAPAGIIWSTLTDGAGYPAWNSTVERIDGRIAPGEKLTVWTRASPGRAFPVTVAVFEPAQRMVWIGGLPWGLFAGTRTFTLTQQPDGAVGFNMAEEYSGLLAPLISRSIPDLQPAFNAFASDLKTFAENR
jgi:hypothetical protein